MRDMLQYNAIKALKIGNSIHNNFCHDMDKVVLQVALVFIGRKNFPANTLASLHDPFYWYLRWKIATGGEINPVFHCI